MEIDGDQLTFVRLLDAKLSKHFNCFIPTNMFIDRATGYFNEAMGFKRDYVASLSAFWDIDTAIYNCVLNPCEDAAMDLAEYGISLWDVPFQFPV